MVDERDFGECFTRENMIGALRCLEIALVRDAKGVDAVDGIDNSVLIAQAAITLIGGVALDLRRIADAGEALVRHVATMRADRAGLA